MRKPSLKKLMMTRKRWRPEEQRKHKEVEPSKEPGRPQTFWPFGGKPNAGPPLPGDVQASAPATS